MKKLIYLSFILMSISTVACGLTGMGSGQPEETTTTAPAPGVSLLSDTPEPADDASAPATDEMASETDKTDEVAEAPSREFTEPLSGGVFRRLWADPPTLDPHLTSDTTSAGIVVEVFSGLVALNVDLQLVPDLAESWTIDNGVVYTFKLRPNATFHNGKPVTAEDFKWSLERAANPKTASPVADTYLNDIEG